MKNKLLLNILLIIYCFTFNISYAISSEHLATTATVAPDDLIDYQQYSTQVKNLFKKALKLTKQNITYRYGSANPAAGGMDCSGTVYYLLHQMNINSVPRQSSDIYLWAIRAGKFYSVNRLSFDSKQFDNLHPGDLLFWTGTYAIKRSPPITHVMIYLGKDKPGHPLMIGASDGRTFNGKPMWGVSVFDFKLPPANSSSHFIGYSCIPQLTCNT